MRKPTLPGRWGEQTYIMGILNITPDSFSGDGILQGEDYVAVAVAQARRFVQAGAHILDVGGESTRPGAEPLGVQEELRRVAPVIQALAAELPGVILSADTYKAEVAEAALQAGAHWINDVWALRADPGMAPLAAHYGALVILMHNRLKPANEELQRRVGGPFTTDYQDLIEEVKRELLASVALARAAGIRDENILLDPGIGFGKTAAQSCELINRLDELRSLGYPLLLGPSRKSFIGQTLNLPADQRLEGTAAAVAVGITRGADIVRVHDVESMARVVRMTDAIVRAGRRDGTA